MKGDKRDRKSFQGVVDDRGRGGRSDPEQLMMQRIERLGFGQNFLGLHFKLGYAVQAMAQLGVVVSQRN